jgi:hypothetical protein
MPRILDYKKHNRNVDREKGGTKRAAGAISG